MISPSSFEPRLISYGCWNYYRPIIIYHSRYNPQKHRSSSTPWIGMAFVLVVLAATVNALSDGEHEAVVYNVTGWVFSIYMALDLLKILNRSYTRQPPCLSCTLETEPRAEAASFASAPGFFDSALRAALRMTKVLDGSRSLGNGGILAVCCRSIRESTLRNERTIVRIRLGCGEWRVHAARDVEDAGLYDLDLR